MQSDISKLCIKKVIIDIEVEHVYIWNIHIVYGAVSLETYPLSPCVVDFDISSVISHDERIVDSL